MIRRLLKHPDKATSQRLLLIYAWNENGEGGYLTPTAKDGTAYLKAVQRGIREDASTGGQPRMLDRPGSIRRSCSANEDGS